jgi:hypothetical protein
MIAYDDSTIELGRRATGNLQRSRMENLKAILGPTYKSWLLPWAPALNFEDDFESVGSAHAADLQTEPSSGPHLEEVKVQ